MTRAIADRKAFPPGHSDLPSPPKRLHFDRTAAADEEGKSRNEPLFVSFGRLRTKR